jgi:hypothetical protein
MKAKHHDPAIFKMAGFVGSSTKGAVPGAGEKTFVH